jgi:hypothetical protein
VCRRLIGHHVRHHVAADQLRQHLGDVPHQPNRKRAARLPGFVEHPKRLVEIGLQAIAVAGLHPATDPALVHVDSEERGAVHGGRERLRAAHPAEAAGHHQAPLERAAEVLARAFREGLVGALENPLRADVDP